MIRPGVPVLMYHGVGDRPAARGELRYTVAEQHFSAQAAWLARHRRVIDLDALLQGRGRPGDVVITFDDGEQSVAELGLPLLRRHGLSATVYVTTGWIGRPGYLSADELRELHRAGWTIGGHGVTHRYLSDLSDAELRGELFESRQQLAEVLGEEPAHMSLPGGRADPRVVREVERAGWRSLGLSLVGLNPRHPDPYALRRTMVLRSFPRATFEALAGGQRRAHARLRLRQLALDSAKRALGNGGYDRLRATLLGRER